MCVCFIDQPQKQWSGYLRTINWKRISHPILKANFSNLQYIPMYILRIPFFSDGAGRSGVYLAIDANIELSEEDGVIDVFGYVRKMRTQRRGLVESLVSKMFSL